jgi:threonine dehydrogenase-like Zn-dependent dehydrogenase
VRPGQHVLVVGAAPVGLAMALFARLQGAQVSVLDSRADRLAYCRDVLAVPHAVQQGDGDRDTLAAITGDGLFDVVFDATGQGADIERGLDLVAHGGTYVLAAPGPGRIGFADLAFHERAIRLVSSRYATLDDFHHVAHAIKGGRVPARALYTHRTTLAELPQILPQWADPACGMIKGIVEV